MEVNGVNLRYHRTEGEKPPLVLLHGFTDNGLCWTRIVKELQEDFDIIMPDSRGHGKSFTEQLDYSLEIASEDIVELIKYLKLEKPIIMGAIVKTSSSQWDKPKTVFKPGLIW